MRINNRQQRTGLRILGAAFALCLSCIGYISCAMAAPAASAAGEPGMRVVRDAQTGALRAPTAEEFKAMAVQEAQHKAAHQVKNLGILSQSEKPQVMRMKNGGIKLELSEDTMVYTVLQRGPDGTMRMQCVTGQDAADKALDHNAGAGVNKNREHQHDTQ